jgi:hypothetical protein
MTDEEDFQARKAALLEKLTKLYESGGLTEWEWRFASREVREASEMRSRLWEWQERIALAQRREMDRTEEARRILREKGAKAAAAFLGVSRGDAGKGRKYPREAMATCYVSLREWTSGHYNGMLPDAEGRLSWQRVALDPRSPYDHGAALAKVASLFGVQDLIAVESQLRRAAASGEREDGPFRETCDRLADLLPRKPTRKPQGYTRASKRKVPFSDYS